MLELKTASTRTAKRRDKLARWIITLGGLAVIASVIAILALIVGVTLPLFRSARTDVVAKCPLPDATTAKASAFAKQSGRPLGLGVESSMDGTSATGFLWRQNGSVDWIDLTTGTSLGQEYLKTIGATSTVALTGVESVGSGKYSLTWANGAASLVEIVAQQMHRKDADKSPPYVVRSIAQFAPEKDERPQRTFVRRAESGALTRVALADGQIAVVRQITTETPLGEEETSTHRHSIHESALGHIRSLTVDHEGTTIYAGTDDGRLLRWRLGENGDVEHREVVRAFNDGRAITALALVLGDMSLAVGDSKGELTTWTPVNADGTRKLQMLHRLQPHASAIIDILPSGRNKSLVSLDADGTAHLDYMTSERHLTSFDVSGTNKKRPAQLALNPRGDTLLALSPAGELTTWRIDAGCPEVSLKTLFGKVHYEGYDSPEYVWQTTGGEDFEGKYSLVPLIFGTLKGTFYAMLFAVPLALFGAVYVSYFTTPGFRRTIKPVVEIMATLPSVVIGFLIALWLAPVIEQWLFGFFLCLLIVPTTFVAFMAVWQLVRRYSWARRVENGYEFLVVLPVLLMGIVLALCLASPLEHMVFQNGFRQWLLRGPLGLQFDQRNCIIIAFGLGFTVIPIIFSIAEDSLSNVPYSMTAAKMPGLADGNMTRQSVCQSGHLRRDDDRLRPRRRRNDDRTHGDRQYAYFGLEHSERNANSLGKYRR